VYEPEEDEEYPIGGYEEPVAEEIDATAAEKKEGE
jgi:hypothetical protein